MGTKTKKIQKLSLKKEIVSSLNNEELNDIKGGWTTSFGECTQGWKALCCDSSHGCDTNGSYEWYF